MLIVIVIVLRCQRGVDDPCHPISGQLQVRSRDSALARERRCIAAALHCPAWICSTLSNFENFQTFTETFSINPAARSSSLYNSFLCAWFCNPASCVHFTYGPAPAQKRRELRRFPPHKVREVRIHRHSQLRHPTPTCFPPTALWNPSSPCLFTHTLPLLTHYHV